MTPCRRNAVRPGSRHALAWLGFALLLAAHAPASSAYASALPALPEHGFTLGFSGAWVSGADATPGGAMLGVDFAYFHDHFWASAGTRLRLESDAVGAVYPYAEAGAWYLINIGLGYSLGIANERSPWSNGHLFVGLPIPLSTEGRWMLPYVEPYYRPMLGDGVVVHEVGVLIKGLLFWESPRVEAHSRPDSG